MNRKNPSRLFGAIGALGLILAILVQPIGAATVTWSGAAGGGDLSWATSANWSGGLPGGNSVVFSNSGTSTTAGTATSLLDTTYTITGLTVSNTSNYHTLDLGTKTLTVNGAVNVAGTASNLTVQDGALVLGNSGAMNVTVGTRRLTGPRMPPFGRSTAASPQISARSRSDDRIMTPPPRAP